MKNFRAYRSSLMGLAMLVFSAYLFLTEESPEKGSYAYFYMAGLTVCGVFLFFCGDGWIIRLKEILISWIKNITH